MAWICEDCDIIVGMVGLFTSWPDAISAGQRALDDRYLGGASNIFTADCRRNESRRDSTK